MKTAAERKAAAAKRAKNRKIRAKLARLRRIREHIAQLTIDQPKRWKQKVAHWQKVAGKLRRELKALGWRPSKRKSSDPLEETDEQDKDEALPEPGEAREAGEEDIPEDGGNDAAPDEEPDDAGGECRCHHANWLHGDEKPTFSFKRILAAITKGAWGPATALGSQGRVQARLGQRVMVVDVAPGLHLVQFVPETLAPAATVGDDVGILPLLLMPGIAAKVSTVLAKVAAPGPGQPGHSNTPPVQPPAEAAQLGDEDEAAGHRRRRRRRPPVGKRAEEEEETDEAAGRRRRLARRGGA